MLTTPKCLHMVGEEEKRKIERTTLLDYKKNANLECFLDLLGMFHRFSKFSQDFVVFFLMSCKEIVNINLKIN